MHAISLLAHDPLRAQYGQVARDSWLVNTEAFGQFVHIALAIGKAVKDRQTCLVRQPLKNAGLVSVLRDGFRLHAASSP